jgi:hypothetical protein
MPVELLAMSYSQYHELEMLPGYLLLLSLVIYPYEGDDRDEDDDSVPFNPVNLPTKRYRPTLKDIGWLNDLLASLAIDGQWIAPMGFTIVKLADNKIELREAKDTPEVKETICRTLLIAKKIGIEAEFRAGRTSEEKLNGARIPLLDTVKNTVGAELAERIPGNGWEPEELHQMTDKTPYDGVGNFADWVCSQTGCVMLDSSIECCDIREGYGEPIFKWTRKNVTILTEEWPRVQEIRSKIDHIVEWLEEDQINHFKELLEFLLQSKPAKKNTLPYDPTDRWCPLDQETDDDEDEEEEN